MGAEPAGEDRRVTADEVEALLEAGAIDRGTAIAALELIEGAPTAESWRRFLSSHLLLVGVTLIGVGVILFFAANWKVLPYGAKELLILGATATCALLASQLGTDTLGGRAAALLAGILVGPALAVYGQHYQTGADPWELFFGWALLLLPFTLVARFPGAWVFELILVQLAWALYRADGSRWGELFEDDALFTFSSMLLWGGALYLWERKAREGVRWMSGRWAPRLLAGVWASVAGVTAVAVLTEHRMRDVEWILVGAAGLSAVALVTGWRRRWHDLFMLAAGGALAVAVATGVLGRVLFQEVSDELCAVLVLGVVLLAEVAALAAWLRKMRRGRTT